MILSKLNANSTEAETIYLDWVNNFLTPARFAEYYETTESDARQFFHNVNLEWQLNNGW